MNTTTSVERMKAEWLKRLSDLTGEVKQWAEELGWSTRVIEKTIEDSTLGRHTVPALLLQFETTRVLLDPVARLAPGAEGVVDLYLMPAYDDIASIYFHDNEWYLHYIFPGQPTVGDIRDAQEKPLSSTTLKSVLEEMVKNAI